MKIFLKKILTSILHISHEEATFRKRGFSSNNVETQQKLEKIGYTFLQGYQAGIESDTNLDLLLLKLSSINAEEQGFAFEGAAMSLVFLDFFTPWSKTRLQQFLASGAAKHTYLAHVGVGWALARIPRLLHPFLPKTELDPLLQWLAIDGYGFHQGYFFWPRYVRSQQVPRQFSGYALRVFDQGLGRSLWFVEGAEPARIATTITAFKPSRHADLWSGVGLACAYAGGVQQSVLEHLYQIAKPYQPQLAQGAAFAAKARQRANNPAIHTAIACKVLCGMSVEAAARVTDLALDQLPINGWENVSEPAYEIWRQRIQAQFATALDLAHEVS